jgi:hypothetical protein
MNMTVHTPSGPDTIFSKDAFGFDPNDNLIKCDLLIETPGDYVIEIANNSTNGESANYGFAFELHPIMTLDLPPADYIVDFYEVSLLAESWLTDDLSLDSLLSPNGVIDFADFAVLADAWLQFDPFYYQY